MASFVGDFPPPRHPAVLDMAADTPITPEAVVPAMEDPTRLPALLRTSHITVTYSGPVR